MSNASVAASASVADCTSCGLTARKVASAAPHTLRASAATVTPSSSRLNSAQRSASLSYTVIRGAKPARCRLPASAKPMLPAPMNPIVFTVGRPYSRVGRR